MADPQLIGYCRTLVSESVQCEDFTMGVTQVPPSLLDVSNSFAMCWKIDSREVFIFRREANIERFANESLVCLTPCDCSAGHVSCEISRYAQQPSTLLLD